MFSEKATSRDPLTDFLASIGLEFLKDVLVEETGLQSLEDYVSCLQEEDLDQICAYRAVKRPQVRLLMRSLQKLRIPPKTYTPNGPSDGLERDGKASDRTSGQSKPPPANTIGEDQNHSLAEEIPISTPRPDDDDNYAAVFERCFVCCGSKELPCAACRAKETRESTEEGYQDKRTHSSNGQQFSEGPSTVGTGSSPSGAGFDAQFSVAPGTGCKRSPQVSAQPDLHSGRPANGSPANMLSGVFHTEATHADACGYVPERRFFGPNPLIASSPTAEASLSDRHQAQGTQGTISDRQRCSDTQHNRQQMSPSDRQNHQLRIVSADASQTNKSDVFQRGPRFLVGAAQDCHEQRHPANDFKAGRGEMHKTHTNHNFMLEGESAPVKRESGHSCIAGVEQEEVHTKKREWQVLVNGIWNDFDHEKCCLLSAAQAKGATNMCFAIGGDNYQHDLQKFIQTNMRTTKTRLIRRLSRPEQSCQGFDGPDGVLACKQNSSSSCVWMNSDEVHSSRHCVSQSHTKSGQADHMLPREVGCHNNYRDDRTIESFRPGNRAHSQDDNVRGCFGSGSRDSSMDHLNRKQSRQGVLEISETLAAGSMHKNSRPSNMRCGDSSPLDGNKDDKVHSQDKARQSRWQVFLQDAWKDLDDDTVLLLEQAWGRGKDAVRVQCANAQYELNLKNMVQINLQSGRERPLRHFDQLGGEVCGPHSIHMTSSRGHSLEDCQHSFKENTCTRSCGTVQQRKWQTHVNGNSHDDDKASLLEQPSYRMQARMQGEYANGDHDIKRSDRTRVVSNAGVASPRKQSTPKQATCISPSGHPANQRGYNGQHLVWQVLLDNGWNSFDTKTCRRLSVALAKGKDAVRVQIADAEYEVNLKSMKQRNLRTGNERRLRQICLDETELPPSTALRNTVSARHSSISRSCASMWQVQTDSKEWIDFDGVIDNMLRSARDCGKTKCKFTFRSQAYEVDIRSMLQVNVASQKIRRVRPPLQ